MSGCEDPRSGRYGYEREQSEEATLFAGHCRSGRDAGGRSRREWGGSCHLAACEFGQPAAPARIHYFTVHGSWRTGIPTRVTLVARLTRISRLPRVAQLSLFQRRLTAGVLVTRVESMPAMSA